MITRTSTKKFKISKHVACVTEPKLHRGYSAAQYHFTVRTLSADWIRQRSRLAMCWTE